MSDLPAPSSPLPNVSDEPAPANDARRRERGLRFVNRIRWLRTLGLGLGFFCVASVFRLHREPWFIWALLVAHGFVWPHAARILALRSADPVRSEFRHLTLDSVLGGVWIALMQFNLLPSVLLVAMLTADRIGVGGVRLASRTTVFLAASCVLTSAALGFAVAIETPTSVVLACMPFLIIYPLAVSHVTHGLATTVWRQNRWLSQLSSTDELTGLANRRQGMAAAEQALARHRRHGLAAVLVVLDIDRFKAVNDRYGHPVGDQILRQVAATLRRCTRITDTPARYAGDEFLLVLPETDLAGVKELARRIRAELGATIFERAPDLSCTVSLGAAEADRDMADVEDWIQKADAALYDAKATGRDRLVSAPTVGASQQHDDNAMSQRDPAEAAGAVAPARHSVAA